ncbi:hypothetical protein PLEOSDRAFT_155745 [Pleurotus ostreatus PC15]|uniref:Uncharacterized protein n=1 Tax=Pleurotus ostreatus (strain PC15) TaxID=1137138 RepID=A0A067NT20_PLEO1|nr:hypothetical protein PLEOSDRAFT_155745 [Pleurotus ostreatus PC15]
MDAPQHPFSLVSQNLRSIGALTVDAYLNNLPNDCLSDLRKSTQGKKFEGSHLHGISPITRLAQACSRAFSLPNLINYELLEKNDTTGVHWKCILTISRPDGQARSYQTEFVHSRKQDARTGAANVALRLGAIEFITSFGCNSSSQRSCDTPALVNDGAETINNVEKIESLCKQWHNEQVTPQWTQFMVVDQQNRGSGAAKYGAALRVQLSPHLLEVYSTDVTFLSYSEAQATCAREAVDSGVLEFIRSASSGASQEPHLASMPPAPSSSNDHMTLHTFFDALPKPFPDFPDPHATTVAELPRAPVAYVNNALQSCRGARFSAQYIWNSDYSHNLHGCLLRVCRPKHTRSYLVDPIFHKRNDAKSAVCLLAFSQGLGSYIRSVAEEIERQVTPTMRKAVTERVLSTISSMCVKASNLLHEPVQAYEYRVDNDAVGCTLKLPMLATYDAKAGGQKLQFKTYVADSVYASKADAKIAAVWQAFNDEDVNSGFQIPTSSTNPTVNGPKGKRKAADAELEPGELNPEPSSSSTKASKRRKRRKLTAGSHRMGMQSDDEDDSQTTPSNAKDVSQAKPMPSAAGPSRPKPSTYKSRSAVNAGRLGGDSQARIRSVDAGLPRLTPMPMYPAGPVSMYPSPIVPYYHVSPPDYRPLFPHARRGDPYGDAASRLWGMPYPHPHMPSMREDRHYQQQLYVPQPPSYPRETYIGAPASAPACPASRPPFMGSEVEEGETLDWT